jgi:hypothetical protein
MLNLLPYLLIITILFKRFFKRGRTLFDLNALVVLDNVESELGMSTTSALQPEWPLQCNLKQLPLLDLFGRCVKNLPELEVWSETVLQVNQPIQP